MRSIYLVMSQTGSILSKTIKFFTGKEYNHISLSLDDSLNCMYSFGRKYPNNPFIGVFVVEGINKGTYLKFKETKCKILELNIEDEEFELLLKNIDFMLNDIEKYKYNLFGLFMALFKIGVHPNNKFYCSEFIKYIFEKSNIDVSMIPEIAHPVDFLKMEHNTLYEGLLRDYSYVKKI